MILHTKDRQFFMPHSFDRTVVQVDMRHFDLFRQGIRIDREPMILRCDCHFPRSQIFDRLITAPMPKFQFERSSAIGKAEHLMTETNSEDRFATNQTADCLVGVRQCFRISGAIGEKNALRVEREHFFGWWLWPGQR